MNDGICTVVSRGGLTHIIPCVRSTPPVIDGALPFISAPSRSCDEATPRGPRNLQLEKCPRAACGVKVRYPSNLRREIFF